MEDLDRDYESWLEAHPHGYIQVIGEGDHNITSQFWEACHRTHNVPVKLKADDQIIMCMMHNFKALYKAIWREAKRTNTPCIVVVTNSQLDHLIQFVLKIDLGRKTEPSDETSVVTCLPVYQSPMFSRWGDAPTKDQKRLEKLTTKALEFSEIYFDDIEADVREKHE